VSPCPIWRGPARRSTCRATRTPGASDARRDRTTALRHVALVVVAVLTFGGPAAAFALSHVRGNVATVRSLDGLIGAPTGAPTDRPAADLSAGRAVTFVMLGSDTRAGENAAIGGEDDGMRADTTIVVHVSADRGRVDAVSIPRDSEALIPACHLDRDPAGRMSRPRTDKFNAAFSIGGSTGDVGLAAAWTLSTIAAATGLAVTEFALVDFAGFQGMVDAIGGIRVCVPTALKDYKENTALDLTAGWHDLDGPQALDYVRARHVTGSDGSDLQRIARQQDFIAAVLRRALSADVLTSPVSLARFLDAGTRSLTMSDALTAGLPGLAWRLRDVEPSAVTFVTVQPRARLLRTCPSRASPRGRASTRTRRSAGRSGPDSVPERGIVAAPRKERDEGDRRGARPRDTSRGLCALCR
jgi:LCP family protein required for cell wall assembly